MTTDISKAARKAGDRYTSDAMICSTCRGLLIRPDEVLEENSSASYDFQTIARSAADGCPLCEHFYSELRWDDTPETLDITVVISCQRPRKSSDFLKNLLPGWIFLKTDRDDGPYRAEAVLWRVLSYGTTTKILEDIVYHQGSVATLDAKTPTQESFTGDDGCMDQVAAWLHECSTNHIYCKAATSVTASDVLPTRLLDVRGKLTKLRLTAELDRQDVCSYMTLSHRWLTQDMPKLLHNNIEAMYSKIETKGLPVLFQDAIALARALGIHFLWIDALCILQDDPTELRVEISNMGHIYRNAILNVGSLKLDDDELDDNETSTARPGLFIHRNPHSGSLPALTIQRTGFRSNYLVALNESTTFRSVDRSPLMQRGWVLQERLLSRRSVYFGKQMYWECPERLASEALPTQLPGYFRKQGFRSPALLTAPRAAHNEVWNVLEGISVEANYIYQNWGKIATVFSECSLSFEQDYLVALSGLAQEFQTALKDKYYAGLWGKDMMRGLLWYRGTFHYRDSHVRPVHYRAPSWSWASVNLRISFERSHWLVTSHIVAEVVEVSTVPMDHDPTGRIIDGRLRISGHVRQSNRTLSKRYKRHVETWSLDNLHVQYEWFDEGYSEDGSRVMDRCVFFLMAYRRANTATANDKTTDSEAKVDLPILETGHVYGLILEAVDTKNSIYRRIGAFGHVWGKERTSLDNPLPEDYPEFVDFDPENFERHTITII